MTPEDRVARTLWSMPQRRERICLQEVELLHDVLLVSRRCPGRNSLASDPKMAEDSEHRAAEISLRHK